MKSLRLNGLKQACLFLPMILFFLGLMAIQAQAENEMGFLGEIRLFAGNYEPRGFRFCDGRIIEISDNQALFSLLGCTYGGNCRTTFALPDLRGRVPLQQGSGPKLTKRELGQKVGAETADIDAKAQGQLLTVTATPTGHTGNSLNVMPPALSLHYIICVEGEYPSRPDYYSRAGNLEPNQSGNGELDE